MRIACYGIVCVFLLASIRCYYIVNVIAGLQFIGGTDNCPFIQFIARDEDVAKHKRLKISDMPAGKCQLIVLHFTSINLDTG